MEECCDICGSVGVPDALVTCSQCKASLQHMYCMRARFLEYPDDWCCEECEPSSKPTFSQLANCSEEHNGPERPSKISKLLNESKRGPFNWEKKVATRKTEYISINDVMKLQSGAIDFSSCSKVTCQSSTSQHPTREEKSCFSLKNSAFDVRWTSSPVHSRSTPCVYPTQEVQRPFKSRQPSQAPAKKHIQKEQPDSQPENNEMDPKIREAFAKKRALQKEAELKKKAARAATAEKKAARAARKIEKRAARAAREAEERASRAAAEGGSSETPHTCPEHTTTLRASLESGFPITRGNIFKEGPLGAGAQIFKSLLTPDEEAHLRGIGSSQKFFEASNLLLQCVYMLTSAFQEVASLAQKDGDQARTMQQLHDQLNDELEWARAQHIEEVERARTQHLDEMARLRVLAEARLGQLEETGAALGRARLETEVLKAQNGDLQARLESSEAQAQEAENARKKSEKAWRVVFLQSKEFKQAVDDRAYSFFETGFQVCIQQFLDAGLLPADREDFPDFDKAIATLLTESIAHEEPGSGYEKPEDVIDVDP